MDNNERERAPYKSPQPTTTQNPRTTGGATTRPAEREPEHVPIKERANVLAIDPEIPEGEEAHMSIICLRSCSGADPSKHPCHDIHALFCICVHDVLILFFALVVFVHAFRTCQLD